VWQQRLGSFLTLERLFLVDLCDRRCESELFFMLKMLSHQEIESK